MKKVFKIIGIVLLVICILVLFVIGFLVWFLHKATTAEMVPKNYIETVSTGGKIEETYLAMGSYETVCIKGNFAELGIVSEKVWGDYVIYYPKELEEREKQYPAVVVVNGTGVGASRYPALFEHLASWGFIVIGNEDPSTCSGKSADATLDVLLRENENINSIFYKKVDIENMGITGHSQGGVGVFNAINEQEHKGFYKCAVSLSPTEEDMASLLGMTYDSSKTDIPIMILAGTENDVISLEKMKDMYNKITSECIIARKTGQGHGEALYSMDGYVTAWFMWQLQGDNEAAFAFSGETAELSKNELYQDVKIDFEIP